MGPLWSRDLLRTPDTCSMYLRLDRPTQHDAGTTVSEPSDRRQSGGLNNVMGHTDRGGSGEG